MKSRGYASSRPLVCNPLLVFVVSLIGAALYALYITLKFSGPHLRGQYFYVVPIVVPFVAFLFDRAERFRSLKRIQLAIDAIVVGIAIGRVIGNVPYISGHTLFLSYALLSTRSRVAKLTAAVVMLQVIYLKYFVWHDWVTSTSGIVIGVGAAIICWWMREKADQSQVPRLRAFEG